MMKNILQFISNFFHPLLSMTWATVLLVLFTPLQMQTWSVKAFLVGEVLFYSCLLPAVVIWILSRLGIVKNGVALRDRNDRIIPLLIQVFSYWAQERALAIQGMPEWGLQFYKGAILLAFVCFLISIWWKISAHAGGNAALFTAGFYLYYQFPLSFPLLIPIMALIIAGGVCSIRVYLGRHTLGQVMAGTVAGCLCMVLGGLF